MFKSPFFWSDYQTKKAASRRPRTRSLPRLVRAVRNTAVVLLAASLLAPLSLRWIDPPTSAFMLQNIAKPGRTKYQWVNWDKISPHLPIAVVAAEDQKFPEHWGFDFDAIGDAIKENKRRSRPRGASTISQQVVKNLFLWSGRSYLRKGLEAYFTVVIETLWPKKRILEVYLNIAEFGPGIYGVESASKSFFDKSARRLNRREAALLAAVLPNPLRLRADRPSGYVQQRARQIQKQMAQLGGSRYLLKISG